MLKILGEALRVGVVTRRYPAVAAPPGPRFRGKVEIDFARCTLSGRCAEACPTPALVLDDDPKAGRATLRIDLGHCVFCGLCEDACGEGAVRLTDVFELAVRRREDLVTTGTFGGTRGPSPADGGKTGGKSNGKSKKKASDDPTTTTLSSTTATVTATSPPPDGAKLRKRILDRLGRSLHIRHVDAGSCNACESELTATTSAVHDLTRFGMDFVASPRHADLLLVTGPVTRAMEPALRATLEAIPNPRLVVALGACAIGGGIHAGGAGGGYALTPGGAASMLPVDVWIPGCPPRPEAILHGLLLAVDRMEQKLRPAAAWSGPYRKE